MADPAQVRLTLYSRAWCHLCDEMRAGLQEMQARFHFEVEVIDVDGDERLDALYGEDVPVLKHGDTELCRHRLNPRLVTDYLAKIR